MSVGTMDHRLKEKVSCGIWTGDRSLCKYEQHLEKGKMVTVEE